MLKGGERGLWVECDIMVKDIADMVEDGRLNAFSWQGAIHRNAKGLITKIDLFEVSVVNIPANQGALLRIGKSAYIAGGDDLGLVEVTATPDKAAAIVDIAKTGIQAVAVLGLERAADNDLDEIEEALLARDDPSVGKVLTAVSDRSEESIEADEKGGDDSMADEKILEALGALGTAVDGMRDGLSTISDRIDALEKRAEEDATEVETLRGMIWIMGSKIESTLSFHVIAQELHRRSKAIRIPDVPKRQALSVFLR